MSDLWHVRESRGGSYETYVCAICGIEVPNRSAAVWHSKRHVRSGEARIATDMRRAPVEDRYEIADSATEACGEHAPSHPNIQTGVSLLPDQTARET